MTRAMTRARLLKDRISRRLVEFQHDLRGVSAIEFAILLPVMLTLYVAGTELSNGIAIDRKVTITARTVTDLVSRVTQVTNADMSGILAATAAVIAPYVPSQSAFTVSQVKIDNNGNATIDWSCAYQGTARTAGSSVTVPSQLLVNNSYLIWGEAQYTYTPPVASVVSGTMTLRDQIYMAPRLSQSVNGPPTCPTTFT
jgi:Flp pilus assembly protein TadG